MVKSIINIALCLSLAAIACNAQLTSVPKRFRNKNIIVDEQISSNSINERNLRTSEFGRRAYKIEKIERHLEVDSCMSMMSMSMAGRRLQGSLSMDYSMSMATEDAPTETEGETMGENEEENVTREASSASTARLSVVALLPVVWYML